MRSSRFKRNKKKFRKLVVLTQVLLIWYAAILSLSFLTTGTAAYFSNGDKVNSTISSAEYWWDKSALVFPNNGTEPIFTCELIEISAELKNVGFDMTGETEFEVYFVENGNPKNKHGTKIGDGQVNIIKAGESYQLTFTADKEGSYMFKVFQREGYDDDYENRQEIWSNKILVKCIPNKNTNEDEQDENTNHENENVEEEVNDSTNGKTDNGEGKDEKETDIEEEEKNEKEQTSPINKEEKQKKKEERDQPQPSDEENEVEDENKDEDEDDSPDEKEIEKETEAKSQDGGQ